MPSESTEGVYKLFGELQVEIRDCVATDEVEIIFYRSTPDYTEIYEMSDYGWTVHRHLKGEMINLKDLNFLRLDRHMAQVLSDGLAKRFIPLKATATEAELGATKHHLTDMRDMLFKTLDHVLGEK